MGDTAEYNRLMNEKYDAQDKLDNALRQRNIIQDRIDRLKTVKRTLSEEYNSFSIVMQMAKSDVQQEYEWKGSQYNQFLEFGSALVDANQRYYENLDDARDEINLEILRLENQLYEQEGLLGWLRSLINSLAHRIENFLND